VLDELDLGAVNALLGDLEPHRIRLACAPPRAPSSVAARTTARATCSGDVQAQGAGAAPVLEIAEERVDGAEIELVEHAGQGLENSKLSGATRKPSAAANARGGRHDDLAHAEDARPPAPRAPGRAPKPTMA